MIVCVIVSPQQGPITALSVPTTCGRWAVGFLLLRTITRRTTVYNYLHGINLMTITLKNFLGIDSNEKPCQIWVDLMVMSHNLTGISIWSFLEHHMILTILLWE
jgi:hypothetical protein